MKTKWQKLTTTVSHQFTYCLLPISLLQIRYLNTEEQSGKRNSSFNAISIVRVRKAGNDATPPPPSHNITQNNNHKYINKQNYSIHSYCRTPFLSFKYRYFHPYPYSTSSVSSSMARFSYGINFHSDACCRYMAERLVKEDLKNHKERKKWVVNNEWINEWFF